MKIFVTGGNGFLGSRTVHELIQKGYEVRCLLREQSDTRRIQHLRFERWLGDIRDSASLEAAAAGCDAIIHLAGISSWEQIRKQESELEPVIVGGTRNVLAAALKNSVRRTVVVSSSAALNGTAVPQLSNEESPRALVGKNLKYSRAKRKMEETATAYAAENGLDVVIVSPCETYGPDDDGLVTAGNLIDLLGDEPALVCEGGTAVAHVDDVARGIVLALEKGRSGENYILGGENLTLAQIAHTVRKLAGKSDRVITLRNSWALALCKGIATLNLTPPVSLDVLDYATLYWFVDSSKAKRELGYQNRSAKDTFAPVVDWLVQTKRITGMTSMRYGGGSFDARVAMIRLFARLQRKKVVILDSNPRLCGEVLAASDTKGTFLEQLFATPAWHPIYSIESMDGERWEQLSRDFKSLMARIGWRERLAPLARGRLQALEAQLAAEPSRVVDSEAIARLVVSILFELLFEKEMTAEDETLFFEASVQWRKEIAVKGKADPDVKTAFWRRLATLVEESKFKDGLESYRADPACWLSLFAQPFLISPQINIGDIFVTVFQYLRGDPRNFEKTRLWAEENDRARLGGVVLEAIRLRHPFPILERELKRELVSHGERYEAGTQLFILLDQFKQDQTFDPERWLRSPAENPYHAIPFAAGPRMCIGKPIAMELLVELLQGLVLRFPEEKIQPMLGHRYSGRVNDGQESFAESRYQAKVFAGGLWQSLKIGRRRQALATKSGCPWKAATSALGRRPF